ncbi:Crooked neck-like protein 1 [Zea mays]|uniref:Crooked neck-like protein 1 n=1 Tax=Zea mays TaxID=4577 RepID=A0A3L6EJJ3_MAIZE|nr:Crooked neck-like protein 1 [Zea mays]
MALTTRGAAASDPSLGFLTKRDTEVKLPRATRVKNKTPAPIQITAEQILREARERQEPEIRPPKQKITDPQELSEYRLRKRKEFEDVIRRVRWSVSAWVKYARWEEQQLDFARARSVYERPLDVAHRDHTLWLKYAEFEMRNRFVNHAGNVWDPAVSLLPRVDQLWYNYIHMEELLGAVANARQVFERWMSWRPDTAGWNSYIKFELRYGEVERARAIYERFVAEHPRPDTFIRYAKFEMKREFEERCREVERARAIYKYALDRVPKGRAEELYRKFLAFEKQFGDREGIEDAIVGKRRFQTLYEKYIEWSPANCYAWRKYAELEKNLSETDRARSIYELAIVQTALDMPEILWKEYLQFEIDENEFERTRQLYERLLDRTKHLKVWTSYAEFEASAGLGGEDSEGEEKKNDKEQKMEQLSFERAFDYFRTSASELKEERAMLLEEWLNKEVIFGDLGDVTLVQKKAPRKVKRKRPIPTEDGFTIAYEEYIDYIFPDEVALAPNLKILEAAYKWKKQRTDDDNV